MSSKVCPSFVACVVGLSLEHGEAFGRKPGVGKSCLCYRFINSGFDDYITTHQSLYALHEFESRVINNDHFLYWGSPVKTFPTVDSKTVDLRVHVIEQTVFYQDITCQPFTIIAKPDKPDCYNKRIVGGIESPGKIAYRSRDEIGSPSAYNAEQYPSGISKDNRGFVVVIDVSQTGTMFEKQFKRAEKVCEYLGKHKRKIVIAATKRDSMVPESLVKVYDLKKKYKTHVVEVSAEHNLNVDEVFRVLAHKLFKKSIARLSGDVQTYPDAAQNSLLAKGSARRSFATFVDKRIRNPHERIDSIENNEEYKACLRVIGKFETDKIFALHLLYLYNARIGMMYAGVSDNPEMREEFLEDFLAQRSDLGLYTKELREWIKKEIGELTNNSSSPVMETVYDHPREAQPEPLVDDYQLFQPRTPSPSQQTQDSGFHQDGATESSYELIDDPPKGASSNDNDSYYSDSDGSEGPDYVNYDPKHPPLPGEPQDLYDDIVKEPIEPDTEAYTDTLSPTGLSKICQPTETTDTSAPSQASADKEESFSSSIQSRAKLLGSLLGHKPASEASDEEVDKSQSPSPPPAVRHSPEPSVKKQPYPLPVKPKPLESLRSEGATPIQTEVFSDQDTQQILVNSPKLSRPPPLKPKPFKPVKKRLPSSQSTDEDLPVQGKTPPPVKKRVSSLPRNMSTESDDSAPNTPKLTRRPSRPAPPPPIRRQDSPTLRKAPTTPPLLPELTPPVTPQDPAPPRDGDKPRLKAIREKVAAKRVTQNAEAVNADKTNDFKQKRKDYEKHVLGSKPHLIPIIIPDKPRRDEPPPIPQRDEIRDIPPTRSPDRMEFSEAPPLPDRTKEMFIIDDPVGKPPSRGARRGKDVSNVTFNPVSDDKKSPSHKERGSTSPKKNFFRSKCSSSSETESVTSPSRRAQDRELPPIPSASAPRSTFLVMKGRPLPLKPFEGHESDEIEDQHDYEAFEFKGEDIDPARPLATLRGRGSLDGGLPHRVKQNVTKQGSLDSATLHQVDTGLTQPWLNDVAKSLNITPTVKKSKTFHGADQLQKPASGVPKGIWPDYIDGYVNPEPPPPGFVPPRRDLPPTPFEIQAKQQPSANDGNPDYDYPDRREFFAQTLPTRGGKAKGRIPIPPRFPPAEAQVSDNRHSVASDQYIHMQGAYTVKDDSYMNIDQFVRPSLQQQYSKDDMSVYMNLPTPDVSMSLPPRQTPQSLPTTGAIADALANLQPSTQWEEQPSEQLPLEAHSLESHSTFENNDQMYMNVIDVSASLPPSLHFNEERGPKTPEVSPRVPRRARGQSQKITLPPRNIPREPSSTIKQ